MPNYITMSKAERAEMAKLALMLDVMRDEYKVRELLNEPQSVPARIALIRLKRLLRERRNLYK